MKLKSQRRALGSGVVGLGVLALMLGVLHLKDSASPDVVRLGTGMASVDARPVSDIAPGTAGIARPAPAASESPMADGTASYYGRELAGNRTASGEIFNPERLTAAHRTLPLGSKVRVTNLRNGESVVVRINDRGPFHGNRVIDLSHAAARTIGLIGAGTGRVKLALLLD